MKRYILFEEELEISYLRFSFSVTPVDDLSYWQVNEPLEFNSSMAMIASNERSITRSKNRSSSVLHVSSYYLFVFQSFSFLHSRFDFHSSFKCAHLRVTNNSVLNLNCFHRCQSTQKNFKKQSNKFGNIVMSPKINLNMSMPSFISSFLYRFV